LGVAVSDAVVDDDVDEDAAVSVELVRESAEWRFLRGGEEADDLSFVRFV